VFVCVYMCMCLHTHVYVCVYFDVCVRSRAERDRERSSEGEIRQNSPGQDMCGFLDITLPNHLSQALKDISLVTSNTTMTKDGSSHWNCSQQLHQRWTISSLQGVSNNLMKWSLMKFVIQLSATFTLNWFFYLDNAEDLLVYIDNI